MTARDVELVVVDDPEQAADRVADRLAAAARAGREIVLTGGSTLLHGMPRAIAYNQDCRIRIRQGTRCLYQALLPLTHQIHQGRTVRS